MRKGTIITLILTLTIFGISSMAFAAKTTVKIWTPHDFDLRYDDVHAEMWAPFEADNPDIKIEWQRIPDWEQKFRISAAGKQLPDIFAVDGINVATYASQGLLAELDEYIPEDVRNDYWPPALEEMTWKGKLYALCLETNSHVIFYNPALLDEAGVEPPVYWEDMIEITKKLTVDKDGDGKFDQYTLDLALGRNEYVMWILTAFIWANNGFVVNEDVTKARINEPESVEAIQFLSDLVNKYYTAPKVGQIQAGPEGAFVGGMIAMNQTGPFMFRTYEKTYPDFKWEVTHTTYPKKGKRVSGVGGWHFSMWSLTKQKDAASKVMQYISTDPFVRVLQKGYGIAVRMSVAETIEEWQKYPYVIAIEQMQVGKARPVTDKYPVVTDATQQCFDKAILGGVSAQEAADEAARRINDALAGK